MKRRLKGMTENERICRFSPFYFAKATKSCGATISNVPGVTRGAASRQE